MKTLTLNTGNLVIIDANLYPTLSKIAWTENRTPISKTSYAHARVNGIPTYMHRLITNAPKGMYVDHINHNGLDNRLENLRIVSQTENMYNRRNIEDQSSKYFGVFRQKGRNSYRAVIRDKIYGKIYIGSYETEEKAARAYNNYIEIFLMKGYPLNEIK